MNSIRTELTRRLLLVLAMLLGVGMVAIYAFIRGMLIESFDTALHSRALVVSALTESEGGKVQFDFSDDFLHDYRSGHPGSYFELWDAAGVVICRSPSLRELDLPWPEEGFPDRPSYWNLRLPSGRAGRAVAFSFSPAPADGADSRRVPPQTRLVVAADRGELNKTLGELLAGVAGGGGFLILAVFLVVPRILRRKLAPLNQFAEQTALIDAGSLATRIPVSDLPLELQPIADRLNDLLSRLEASFERERRFSADLAHELRTPLAELRSVVECAIKWPHARDPASDDDLLAIATNMESLVTRMLALARGERGQLAVRCESVDLTVVATAAWRPFAARAAARSLQVELPTGPIPATADLVLLRSILGNLFDNAVDYTPPGGEIVIAGETGGGLRVANTAGGLAPNDVARIFERFWRKEAARSGGEHVGLGLSLARIFAQAMDWRLEAALEADRIVFRLGPAGNGTGGAA